MGWVSIRFTQFVKPCAQVISVVAELILTGDGPVIVKSVPSALTELHNMGWLKNTFTNAGLHLSNCSESNTGGGASRAMKDLE